MSKLYQKYAEIMENHPFGIALFRPLLNNVFKPGSCGYFDEFGSWNPICDLEDEASVESKNLTPMGYPIEKAPLEQGINWSAKMSANTKGVKLPLTAGVDPYPGIPFNVSAVYEYSTNKDVGAVLLTKPPITHERFYHTYPLKTWVKENGAKLLMLRPEVKQHNLWIVTSTYSTKKCSINMWNGKNVSFKVGFSAGVGGTGASGNVEWYQTQKDEGWSEYDLTDRNDGYVVFFGGLSFQFHRKLTGNKELKPVDSVPVFRGGSQEEILVTIPDPDSDQAVYDIRCESWVEEEDDERAEEVW